MKRVLLLSLAGALISLTSCSRGRIVIPAHPIPPQSQPLTAPSVVFQLDHEPFSLSEDVYYKGNIGGIAGDFPIGIFASNPLQDSILIDLASGYAFSGDTMYTLGGKLFYHYRGNFLEFNEVTATVIYSGDTISGYFSGTGYSDTGSAPVGKISGSFLNVPPQQ